MYTHRTPRNTQLKQASATSNREEEIEKINTYMYFTKT